MRYTLILILEKETYKMRRKAKTIEETYGK
jgi:hypothetical protein